MKNRIMTQKGLRKNYQNIIIIYSLKVFVFEMLQSERFANSGTNGK